MLFNQRPLSNVYRSAAVLAMLLLFVMLVVPSQTVAATLPAGFTETLVTGGLTSPTAMAFGRDGRLFVCQQNGVVRVVKNGTLLPNPFTTVTTVAFFERGLLGIAFDPNFAQNQYVYLYYTAQSPTTHNRVSRFTANGDVAAVGSELAILDLETLSAGNHNGGAIHFGPDGKLYVAVGENAVSSNAQSINNRLGKLLRINSDGSIPFDNPTSIPGIAGTIAGDNRAIWSAGLRNPYTFAFQPGTGRLFINDVGQSTWEEIDDGIIGSNYGWPSCEGNCGSPNPNFRDPLHQYPNDASSCAITGGAFYNPIGGQFPVSYTGKYFFADYCGGFIRSYDPVANTATGFATGIASPLDLIVGGDGSLYYLAKSSGTNGSVFRVRYTQSSISGRTLFSDANGGAKNVTMTITAPSFTTRTTITDVNGDYSFTDLPAGNTYTVTPSKTGANGIDSDDAIKAARFVAGLDVPTANQKMAADADGDGTLTSYDATLIARFAGGQLGTGIVGTWKFTPATLSFPAFGASQADQNFTAILVGDATGSWVNSRETGDEDDLVSAMLDNYVPNDLGTVLNPISDDAPSSRSPLAVTVSLPATGGIVGTEVSIPVTVGSLSSDAVKAYDLQVTFDPAVLQPVATAYSAAGTISSGMTVTQNTNNAGHLILSAFQTSDLAGSGTLILLRFNVVGSPGQTTPLTLGNYTDPNSLQHAGFRFNNGAPAATIQNGSLVVNAGPTPTPTATPTATPTPSGTPLCTNTLYAVNTGGVLHTINISTGAATLIGMLATTPSTEIEYDPLTGRAFSQTGGFEFNGQEINIVNGLPIGAVIPNSHTYTGLEWVGPNLYGTSIDGPNGSSTLRILNPWTGSASTIGLTGRGPISGLAYNAGTNVMYGIEGGSGIHDLVTLNLSTGAATLVGSTGIRAGSLEYGSDGLLYAGGALGEFYRINPANGAATLIGNTGIGAVSGLANACPVGATPTPTATPTNTPTATPTATPTNTPTATPTATPTNTPTATPTNTPTATPTATPTNTPTATPTATPTNTPTATPTPFPEFDLTISQSDSPDPVVVGRPLTYTLTVTNSPTALGGGACPEVRFKFPIGVPIALVSATGTNGYVSTPTANGLSFTGGCLSSAGGSTATATITIVIRPTSTGTLTSIGTDVIVDPDNLINETNNGNNTAATVQTAVVAAPVTALYDYDGDDRSDISVYRPSAGNWYLQQSTAGFFGVNFGIDTDRIAPADYDGDGKTDVAVYRPSTGIWYVTNSSNGTVSYYGFGIAEDLPTPADYDGDGKADISVFRPSSGTWYRINSSDGSFTAAQFGANGDRPTVGDFDGDDKADVAVFRPSTGAWYQTYSSNGFLFGEQFGISTDRITHADYDGDGKTDLGIYRPSEGLWYFKNSATLTYTPYVFGLAGDIPVPGDFDGDGKADIGVFRPSDGTWYIVNSTNGSFTIFQFGQNGDNPTQNAFNN